jgi:hypothetical protein
MAMYDCPLKEVKHAFPWRLNHLGTCFKYEKYPFTAILTLNLIMPRVVVPYLNFFLTMLEAGGKVLVVLDGERDTAIQQWILCKREQFGRLPR